MRKFLFLMSLITISAIAFSCSKSNDANPTVDTHPVTPGPKFLAVKAVINSSCAISGCHVSPTDAGGHSFETDENIIAHGAHIYETAVVLGNMPPKGPLSPLDKAKISDWISAGGRLTD
jgi:uncharacterized membrane protein